MKATDSTTSQTELKHALLSRKYYKKKLKKILQKIECVLCENKIINIPYDTLIAL